MALVEVNGINLVEAKDKGHTITIDPEGEVNFEISYTVVGEYPISIDGFKIIIVFLDLDTYSSTQELDVETPLGGEGSIVQTIKLKDYLGVGDIQFVSGIYKLRVEVYYSVEGRAEALEGEPFYVRITGNPMMTGMGVVAVAGVASAGISIASLAWSAKEAILFELNRSIMSTKVSPTAELMNFYKGRLTDRAQSEVTQRASSFARKTWRREKCPSCGSKWPEGQAICPKCGVTLEEAEKLYSKLFGEKCLKACEEVGVSVSGLNISEIAQSIGERMLVTTDIISFLAKSGLALVEPHVGKRMKASTRKLVFTGLYTCIVSLFWIQACGLEAVSLYMLIFAILTGIVLPMIISRLLDSRIRSSLNTFWKTKLEPT